MITEIISIGDEILSGNVLDTNQQFLSTELWQIGLQVEYHAGVRDDETSITDVLLRAAQRSRIIICTGGLGPTVDDFTIEVAAKTFGLKLVEDRQVLEALEGWFTRRGRELKANNRKQALVPEGAVTFHNEKGTAPGIALQVKSSWFYFLPGVPTEMKHLFFKDVLPHIQKHRCDQKHFATRFLKTFGCPESVLDDKLKDLFTDRVNINNARIGFRAHFPEVAIKVSVWDKDQKRAESQLESVVALVKERVGEFIYSEDTRATLESVLVEKLRHSGKTIALAESCTGGLIANRITNVSGASDVFLGGFVTYSNALKTKLLGVSETTLKNHGAVSEECAREMVAGARRVTGANYCAAVTGIAGPTGGSDEKPVGTVHIAYDFDGVVTHEQHVFPFARTMFKELVASVVIKRLFPHTE